MQLEENPHKSEWEVIKSCGYRLDQLQSDIIPKLLAEHFVMIPNFLPISDSKVLLPNLYKRLELMEVEGRFEINRTGFMLPPEKRPRNDKMFSFNMT